MRESAGAEQQFFAVFGHLIDAANQARRSRKRQAEALCGQWEICKPRQRHASNARSVRFHPLRRGTGSLLPLVSLLNRPQRMLLAGSITEETGIVNNR